MPYETSRLDGSSVAVLWRRYPWLAASVLTHVLLGLALYTSGPVRVELKRDDKLRTQVNHALQQTSRREMQRQLRTMEEIKEALEQSAGAAPARQERKPAADAAARKESRDPAEQARRLAAAIETVQQKIRAAEMARVLRIPEQEALKRVRAEEARRPKPPVPKNRPPEAVVAQLAAQAKAALAQRRAQLLAQQQGVKLNMGRGGGGGEGRHGGGPPGNAHHAAKNGGGISGGAAQDSAALGGRLNALSSDLGLGNPLALSGSTLDMSSAGFSDQRSYGSFLAPPPVDQATLRTGAGRTLGAGGPYANRIFLDTWYVIGPFGAHGRGSIDEVYPPERGLDLDAVYYGMNDQLVRWNWQQELHYPFVPRPRAENAVYYAYTEVTLERDMDMWVAIGADDDSKMWFNERLVWISGMDNDKPWYRRPFYSMHAELAQRNLTEGQRKLHFHKGRNTILFKLYNGMNLMFFSVVLSPAD
ncbi:hypothetical protein ACFQ09_17165 [Massilia norwichensis]|uniref:Uncharacterized protein n=1 Tax=Massilia norwichensis TaxID=1442366 RepID=A0ABT2AEJ7_9BURK|nr:hypothetical protein [Massilia norwichensis]MCS0592185.1 hypothetical protein [Massilia norwichensis]